MALQGKGNPERSDDLSALDWAQSLSEGIVQFLPLQPVSATQLQQLSPAALAYLGDAVYELYVRTRLLMPPKRLQIYHQEVVARVRAESQAECLRSLEPHLTPQETDMLRRGRNAASKSPKRVEANIYQQATSFETLLGYLYLTDPGRLVQLLAQLDCNF